MSRCTFAGLFAICAGAAFAQLDSNTVTVAASRSSNPPPDQAVFLLSVDSGLNATLNDILSALQGSGITLSNFTGVSTIGFLPPPQLEWTFALFSPLTDMKDTVLMLTRLQQSIAQGKTGLTVFFAVQGPRRSPQAQQSPPCVAANLIADARAQAQKIAGGAGLTALSILSMSGATPDCSVTVTFAVGR